MKLKRIALALSVPVAASLAALSFAGSASAQTPAHIVRSGDTLWAIGVQAGVSWPTLAAYNHIANPDLIFPGQVIKIPPAGWKGNPPQVVTSAPAQQPVSHYSAPRVVYAYHPPAPVQAPRYVGPSSSFEACVIARESGGNSQIWGGAGGAYWGLYQFSYSTWVANGGSPGSYGNASAAQQHAVFARSSPSNWAPYDGC
jgi:LysM repeat protein